MFDNLTYAQLTELRAALWAHYETVYAEHAEEMQQLASGSEEMEAAIEKWETRRSNIKAAQNAVETAIKEWEKNNCPKAIRRK